MPAARGERTVLAALPRAMLTALVELGHDADALRAGAGLTIEELVDPDGRVPLSRHLALWELIAAIGPTIGLELGARLGLRALGVLGFVLEHRATLGEALRDLERFRRVVFEDAVPRLLMRSGPKGREAVLVQNAPARVIRLQRPVETQATATFTALRALAGDGLALRAVRFPHPEPANVRPYEVTFGVRPDFGAPRTEIVFDAGWIHRPNRRANPALADYLAVRAERLAHDVEEASLGERVRAALGDSLAEAPTPGEIARALGMSSRTMQRKLAEEALTFSALQDEARRERALVLVDDRSKTAGEIAFSLGLRETATFFRAFRRWTGTTPRLYRTRAGR